MSDREYELTIWNNLPAEAARRKHDLAAYGREAARRGVLAL
jgi:hypothetical protein